MGGHLGADKILGRLCERFYWPGYYIDITDWCQNCAVRASHKTPAPKARAPLQPIVTGHSLELVATDIVGPLPESPAGNSYILVVADYFTRYAEAYPIPNQQEACKLLGIDKSRTTPYHPQSDGLIERFNRTLLVMLAMAVRDQPFEWEQHIRRLCFAYNTSVHPTTGFSPFSLMFGRQAQMPMDIVLGTTPNGPTVCGQPPH